MLGRPPKRAKCERALQILSWSGIHASFTTKTAHRRVLYLLLAPSSSSSVVRATSLLFSSLFFSSLLFSSLLYSSLLSSTTKSGDQLKPSRTHGHRQTVYWRARSTRERARSTRERERERERELHGCPCTAVLQNCFSHFSS